MCKGARGSATGRAGRCTGGPGKGKFVGQGAPERQGVPGSCCRGMKSGPNAPGVNVHQRAKVCRRFSTSTEA